MEALLQHHTDQSYALTLCSRAHSRATRTPKPASVQAYSVCAGRAPANDGRCRHPTSLGSSQPQGGKTLLQLQVQLSRSASKHGCCCSCCCCCWSCPEQQHSKPDCSKSELPGCAELACCYLVGPVAQQLRCLARKHSCCCYCFCYCCSSCCGSASQLPARRQSASPSCLNDLSFIAAVLRFRVAT